SIDLLSILAGVPVLNLYISTPRLLRDSVRCLADESPSGPVMCTVSPYIHLAFKYVPLQIITALQGYIAPEYVFTPFTTLSSVVNISTISACFNVRFGVFSRTFLIL